MVAAANRRRSRRSAPAWHEKFLAMLPAIETHAKISFRHLDPEAREEAVQETVCNACAAVARLAELGKLDLAYPSPLANYAVSQVRDGRVTGGHLNCRDVLSPYCQKKRGSAVVRLDKFDPETGQWRESLLEDRRAGPADTAAARIDVNDWFGTLRKRDRKIAADLAIGERTRDVAAKFRLTPARISQKRQEFYESWQGFQGEVVPAA